MISDRLERCRRRIENSLLDRTDGRPYTHALCGAQPIEPAARFLAGPILTLERAQAYKSGSPRGDAGL
jgi:hypothetical protein